MEAHFIVYQENGTPKKFRLDESEYVVLGRNATKSQVHIDDDLCSSMHCKISFLDEQIFVEDLDSKNGVTLNGHRITKQRVFINDKIKFGKTTVYLNPKRMDEETVLKCTHDGKSPRDIGGLALDLGGKNPKASNEVTLLGGPDGPIHPDDQTSLTLQDIRTKKIKDAQRKMSRQIKNETSVAPISRAKLNLLKYFANVIDVLFSIFSFTLTTGIVIGVSSELGDIAKDMNFLRFLFSEKMLPYSIACALFSFFVYHFNRRVSSGSLGERLLKINDILFK